MLYVCVHKIFTLVGKYLQFNEAGIVSATINIYKILCDILYV